MQHTLKPQRKFDTRIIWGVLAIGIIALLVAFIVIPRLSQPVAPAAPDYWPTTEWRTALPETQGIDSTKLADALLAYREQDIQIHSLLVIRDGYVVADATFYPYDGQSVHDVASVTKSVMTTLIGIAIDQGQLSLDDKMVSFFPDRAMANRDARKETITVRHLVSMSSGLRCIRDGRQGETVADMHASDDTVQFALDLPVTWEPGSGFIYCSPAIALLSPILQQATGMPALDFARQHLFEPLGIQEAAWEQETQGTYNGWGDLSLLPRDMAKIGFLFLHQGQWDGQQVVSRDWVEAATTTQATTPDDSEDPYGFGWWMSPDRPGVFRADGRLGQYIIVLPEWDMVLVTTGGGFEIDQIAEPLLASFADLENPLPANPDGVAKLDAAIAAVAQPPAASPVPPLPDIARAISGQTYVFERNSMELDSFAFDFDDSAEAVAHLGAEGLPVVAAPIGLDSLYRYATELEDGRTVAFRGRWVDEQTFLLEYNGVITNDHWILRFNFPDEERVIVTVSQTVDGPGFDIEGRTQP